MKLNQVAAQLYTVRDFLKTPADIAASLKRIAAIGYPAVQLSGLGPIDEAELLRILKGQGLTCCATHEPGDQILNDTQRVIDRLHKLGCNQTAYPYPAGVDFGKTEEIEALAKKLDAAGAAMAKAGQTLSYHNHAIEFVRCHGRTALEFIFDATHPRHLQAELDTYWVQYGGGDPVAWCRRMKNRLPLLHMKDYGFAPDNKPYFAEIGNGNLHWTHILSEAKHSGCQWFIVEQDDCPGDPFKSLEISFRFIRDHLCT